MKQGFTFIEILIATTVASILATALFFSYAQINKVFVSTKNYIDQYEAILLMQHQLSKDLAGAFIPVQAVNLKDKKQPQKQPDKTGPTKEAQAKSPEQAVSLEQQEKKAPVLKDPFISKNHEKNMQMLSFITNNATRVFVGKKTGEVKSNTARVVYTLEKDQYSSKDMPAYILYRQEGSELNLKQYTKADSAIERYPLVHNIKSCTLTFEVIVDQKHEETAKDVKKSAAETKKKVKQFSDWHMSKDEKDPRAQAKLPHKVTCKCVLWNDKQTTQQEFTFTVIIMAAYNELPSIEQPKSSPTKPVTDKQASPASDSVDQRKQQLASGANKVVNNIRALLGT